MTSQPCSFVSAEKTETERYDTLSKTVTLGLGSWVRAFLAVRPQTNYVSDRRECLKTYYCFGGTANKVWTKPGGDGRARTTPLGAVQGSAMWGSLSPVHVMGAEVGSDL